MTGALNPGAHHGVSGYRIDPRIDGNDLGHDYGCITGLEHFNDFTDAQP